MKYFTPISGKREGLKPPELYEYFLDNFWFKASGLENEIINEPLRGERKADVVIIGGGYTGLSSAYNIHRRFPDKKIILLEGACCGYGASGRNGGFCVATSLIDPDLEDPDARKKNLDVSLYGIEQIKECIDVHGLDCDFKENGMLDVAMNDAQVKIIENERRILKQWGLDVETLYGKELEKEIKSPRCVAGLKTKQGAILNPAKLARGMKKIVENMGVEIRERSLVTRVVPGKVHHVDTEFGEVKAPAIVIATNAYSHKLGFFQNRLYPIYTYVIATEPLNSAQWEAIGWRNRQGLSDYRMLFNYMIPSIDGRIIIGGSDTKYYHNDGIAPGNNKSVSRDIIKDLVKWFPSLEGIKVDHAWGGPTAGTLDYTPSIGVMGDYNNIYYGVAYNEGVPSTQTGGRIIADLMAGEKNEFTTHLVVNRNIPYAGPKVLRSFFGVLKKWYMVNVVKNSGHIGI
jgi:glycine/D-amino acid oxidase-like deaminating enzyme